MTSISWVELVAALAAWTTLSGGFFAFIIKLMIKSALSDFLLHLESTFIRAKEVENRFQEIERRLNSVEYNHGRE